ncbi:MAG: SDR family oxidoreductase [Isosphaeraceae bacterium]
MRGKTCLVTGATSGIGLVTALELALKGATVFIVGRSPERCDAAVDQIRAGSTATLAEVGSFVADLSSLADVRRLAASVRDRCPRLDVLINNAGGIFLAREESVDGIEMTLALNHLSYYHLANLLLPQLNQGHPARIVNVASDAHKGVSISFDDIEGKDRYSAWRAYRQSKLANLLFTYELARRLEGTSVTVSALHPGFVRTNIFRHPTWRAWLVRRAADLIALSPERGARTSVYLASSPDVGGITGGYFVNEKPAASSRQSHDLEAASRLWELSRKMTGI